MRTLAFIVIVGVLGLCAIVGIGGSVIEYSRVNQGGAWVYMPPVSPGTQLWFGCAASALLMTYLARRLPLTRVILTGSAGLSTFLAGLGLWTVVRQHWEDSRSLMTPDVRVWRDSARLPWEVISIVMFLVCTVVFAATLHTVWSERRS